MYMYVGVVIIKSESGDIVEEEKATIINFRELSFNVIDRIEKLEHQITDIDLRITDIDLRITGMDLRITDMDQQMNKGFSAMSAAMTALTAGFKTLSDEIAKLPKR